MDLKADSGSKVLGCSADTFRGVVIALVTSSALLSLQLSCLRLARPPRNLAMSDLGELIYFDVYAKGLQLAL
jgi:hypothetical protein